MKDKNVDLFILESVWEDKLNSGTSVKPFFDGLCRSYDIKYIYHTFYDKEDLRHFIEESKRQKLSCPNYYIAAHGNRDSIEGLKKIRRGELKDIFENFHGKGIYFGSCNFINYKNAKEILNYTKADWIAGYKREVDWFDSTIIDIIFWHNYFQMDKDKRFAWNVAQKIYTNYPTSIELEFAVFDKVYQGKKVNNSLQYFKKKG